MLQTSATEDAGINVGDRVRLTYMEQEVTGRVVEDWGCIGAGGRHLYRVTFKAGSITRTLDLPRERLVVVER